MRTIATAIAVLVILSVSVDAQTFQTHPPTDTLNGSTAYTLNRGEFRVGSLNLFVDFLHPTTVFRLNQLKWLDVEYGLTDRLQVGTTVLETVLEGPNVWAKFTAIRTRTWAVAMPLSIDVNLSPVVAGVGSGVLMSWTPTRTASLHGGLRFSAFDGQVQLSRIHAALEYALVDHTHLWAEADIWPLGIEVGTLSRYRMLNLEISSRLVEDAAPTLDLELELFVRF